MNLPPKKNRGDPILARDWNLLIDAVAARTPRTGSGLHLSQTAAGFAYQFPAWPQAQRATPPPFGLVSIAAGQDPEVFGVHIQEGWVIERKPVPGEDGQVVVLHMPKYGSSPLDSVPRPLLPMADGDTAWCTYATDKRGIITGEPEIIVAAADQPQAHYAPSAPYGGRAGTYAVKLLRLALENGRPAVTAYQRSDIEHTAPLWTGENTAGGVGVLEEYDAATATYRFRSIAAGNGILVEAIGDTIRISLVP